jgi:hypothetical protein
MCTNRKERFHFQLSCGICVCVSYLFLPRLDIIHSAAVHSITLSGNVSTFVGAAAKYRRRPCG